MLERPSRTVTFLFTDIEGSTRLLQEWGPETYTGVLLAHQQLMRSIFQASGGHEVDTQGDAFFVAFNDPGRAIEAAVAAQRALAAQSWPGGIALRVRMGLHTGDPLLVSGRYFGLDVHQAARIGAASHGGQVLLSQRTRDLAAGNLPGGVGVRDLGERRLKDLRHPQRLYQLLIPGLPTDFPPIKTLDARPHNLPVHAAPLVGRQKEVAAVEKRLRQKEVRLVTLTGPGGTGKTRLAVQAAANLIDDFAHGIFFVGLAALRDPDLVVPTIAQTLEIQETAGRTVGHILQDFVRDKELLLVLDNFEQVLAAGPRVAELLTTGPGVKVLATSRASLRLSGEHEMAVPPLSLPDPTSPLDLEHLSQFEAVALFVERALAVYPDLQLTDETVPTVANICVRLDGLPLAIELAAARTKVLPPRALLARLDNRLALLTGGPRDLPARQQTLRATIDWSYGLLDDAEQALFRRLAVFCGGITLDALAAVYAAEAPQGDGLVNVLASLADKSLLWQREMADGEPRFLMLETIREYALELLEASDEAEEIRGRHATFFLRLAESAEPALTSPERQPYLQRLEGDHDNLRAALSRFVERGQSENALRLAAALRWFWYFRGYLSEGRASLQEALSHPSVQSATTVRAKALHGAGQLAYYQGDYVAARNLLEESVNVWRQLNDRQGLAYALIYLGLTMAERSTAPPDPLVARSLLEESVARFRGSGDRWGLALSLGYLGIVTRTRGEWEAETQRCLEESQAMFEELGDDWGRAAPLYYLGGLAERRGEMAAARSHIELSLALLRQSGDGWRVAVALSKLAEMARDTGDYKAATAYNEESLALFRALGDRDSAAWAMYRAGPIAQHQGNHAQAVRTLQEALVEFRDLKNPEGIAHSLTALGGATMLKGNARAAVRILGAADALLTRLQASLLHSDRVDRDRSIARGREVLGEDGFGVAWAEGQAMTLAEAIAYALEERGER